MSHSLAVSTPTVRSDASSAKPAKGRRPAERRVAFSRKRAVAACEVCRLRKSKCDNQKPSCGTCMSYGAACIYRESDHSTFDAASLAIIARVDHAIRLLESRPQGTTPPAPPTQQSPLPPFSHDIIDNVTYTTAATPPLGKETPAYELQDDTLINTLNTNSRCSCAHVLQWPIFENSIRSDVINPGLFDFRDREQTPCVLFIPDQASKQALALARASGRIKQEEAVTLVESFLRNVHTKNPVLEPNEIKELARAAAEDGFEWDVSSCLILISCAVGSLSTSWTASHPHQAETSFADADTYSVAEAYYTAARKRLGLLERSVQATQCWFLTGIYEMYSMRPMSAWMSFNRACTLIQLRLQVPDQGTDHGLGDLEQRLYWSCLKSESEMREEFELPSSGLGKVEYPDIFPSPPISSPDFSGGSVADLSEWESVHQSSWYYYLSEVAYRRIVHRTITTLYSMPPEQWSYMGVQRLHRIAAELDAQILQWWQHIPGAPLPTFQQEADELTFMMLLNYFDLRERIWRPFLYVAVHCVSAPQDQEIIRTCATQCLDLSFEMIEGSTVKHRHHGCWLTARCLVTKALLIIAAAQSAQVDIRHDWRDYLQGLQTFLQYWQVEAPDLGSASCAITRLLANFVSS